MHTYPFRLARLGTFPEVGDSIQLRNKEFIFLYLYTHYVYPLPDSSLALTIYFFFYYHSCSVYRSGMTAEVNYGF